MTGAPPAGSLRLKTVIGNYPHAAPLKDGRVGSDLVELEHIEYDPVHSAFDEMIEHQPFDVCEMAIATYLQAKDIGVPITLLPVVMVGRFQHRYAVYDKRNGERHPEGLSGSRIGVRSYTVTTGMWVRGILQQQYGLDLASVRWVTFEPPHIAGYRAPEFVEQAPEGSDMLAMLRAGDLDAAVIGGVAPVDPNVIPLIPDLPAATRRWYGENKVVPINHLVVVRTKLLQERPEVLSELVRMFREAKQLAGTDLYSGRDPLESEMGVDPLPIGVDAVAPAVSLAAEYAHSQRLVSKRFDVRDVFGDLPDDL